MAEQFNRSQALVFLISVGFQSQMALVSLIKALNHMLFPSDGTLNYNIGKIIVGLVAPSKFKFPFDFKIFQQKCP